MQLALATGHSPPLAVPLVFLLLCMSSVVFIEPAPYDVFLLVLLAAFFAAGLGIPREIRGAGLLLGLFVLGNLLASTLAPEPLQTLRSLSIRIYMALAWLFFVCLVASDPERILPAIWKGYLVAALAAALFGIFEYYGLIGSAGWAGGMRAKGPFKDPNVYGPFLVPVVLYCVNRLRQPTAWGAPVYGSVLLVATLGILLSFSRGAWVNLLLSLALLLALLLVTRRPGSEKLAAALVGVVAVLAAAGIVAWALSFTSAGERFRERAVIAQSYDLQQGGRFYTQQRALERIGVAPLGLGPGRTDDEFGLEPHNLYLHVLVEGGWIAGLAFIGALALTLARARRVLRSALALRDEFIVILASLLGILAQSLFIDSTHWRHLWLLLGLCWGLIVVAGRAVILALPVRDTAPPRTWLAPPQRPRPT
jgi:O-antigen ligase